VTVAGRLRGAVHQLRRPTLPLELRIRGWVTAQGSLDPAAFHRFGEGSWVVPPTHVSGPERIDIGRFVVLLEHATLAAGPEGRIVIGDRVRLGPFLEVHASQEVVLGADVSGSDNITIVDSWDQGRPPVPGGPRVGPPGAPVRVGAGAYLGANCTIGPGVTVGEGAFVGEGSLVLDDVPARTVVYGNPSVVVRRWDEGEGRWIGDNPVGRQAASA
jgi:acetyltransferase-like isoleucine patch superfamily enzyme